MLSGDARALSGLEITLSGAVRYRFEGFDGQPASIFAATQIQRVVLSQDAKKQAPEANAADYAFDAFEIGYSQVVSSWDEDVVIRLDGILAATAMAASRSATMCAGRRHELGDRRPVARDGGASLERQVRLDQSDRSAWVSRLDGRRIWQVNDAGDIFGIGGGLRIAELRLDRDRE